MENNKSLMSIEADACALEQLIFENAGELNETLETWLDQVHTELAVKADAYAAVMDRMTAGAELMKSKAAKYTQAARSMDNVAERLKLRIKDSMIVMGKDEIVGDNIRFKLSNAAPKMELIQDKIPEKYFDIVTTKELNKDRVKEVLKAGGTVEGATLVEVKSLRTYVKK